MKVAVCSTGDKLDSQLDPRFGRCAYFVLVDTDTLDSQAVENPGVMSAQGAGIQAAQLISSLGASAVIAGNLGPNAHQALAAAGIKTYGCTGKTVRDAVDALKSGALEEISGPTVGAHFGMNTTPGQGTGSGPGGGGGMGRGGGRGQGSGRQ